MTQNSHEFIGFILLAQWIKALAAIKLVAFALTLAIFLVIQPIPASAAAAARRVQTGVVTHVVDGDTVWLQTPGGGKALIVRIEGMDAPEICQSGGVQAQQALKSRVLGQTVTLAARAHDRYGRTVGVLYLQGQDVGRWLVANGHAWIYSYHHKRVPYADELAQARAAGKGLFSDTAAEEPRLFRKRTGSCYSHQKRHSSYKKSSGF